MEALQDMFNVMKDSPCMEVLNVRNNNYTSEEVTAMDPIFSLVISTPTRQVLF